MSEITAEKIKALLDGITDGVWIGGNPNVKMYLPSGARQKIDSEFIAAAPAIARAFIAKCEEVDQVIAVKEIFVKKWSAEEDSALALERENKRLQEEFEQFKVHAAQMMVNQMSAFETIQEENIQLRKEALALTQQQTGGAV